MNLAIRVFIGLFALLMLGVGTTLIVAPSLLAGQLDGYVYQRDGHPNADRLAERIGQLHGAERTAVVSSGMAALAAAPPGDDASPDFDADF